MDLHTGGVAQMVERSLSMREVPGSIPGASKELFFVSFFCFSNFKMFIEIKVFLQVTHSLSSKTKGCIVRESNPGRPRGRRAFYHWTNDAADIGGGPKVSNWACHLTFSPRTSKTVNFHIYHLSFNGHFRMQRINYYFFLGGGALYCIYLWKIQKGFLAVGRIRTYAPRGNLISSQTP